MAIGLGTALAIGAISSAAGSAVKAKKQSTAAKKAAEQQVQGTQDASGYAREGLGQIGQLYAPYINSGAGAMGTLSRLTTPGPGARFASPGPPNAMPGGMGQPPPQDGRFAIPREGGPPMGPPMGYRPRPGGPGGSFDPRFGGGAPQDAGPPPPQYDMPAGPFAPMMPTRAMNSWGRG